MSRPANALNRARWRWWRAVASTLSHSHLLSRWRCACGHGFQLPNHRAARDRAALTEAHEPIAGALAQLGTAATQGRHTPALALPRKCAARGRPTATGAGAGRPSPRSLAPLRKRISAATGCRGAWLAGAGELGARTRGRRPPLPRRVAVRGVRRLCPPTRQLSRDGRAPALQLARQAALAQTQPTGASWPPLPGSHGCRGDGWPAAAPSARRCRGNVPGRRPAAFACGAGTAAAEDRPGGRRAA